MPLHGFGYVIGGLFLFGALTLIIGLVWPIPYMVVIGIIALVIAGIAVPMAVSKLRGALRGIEQDFEVRRHKAAREAEEENPEE